MSEMRHVSRFLLPTNLLVHFFSPVDVDSGATGRDRSVLSPHGEGSPKRDGLSTDGQLRGAAGAGSGEQRPKHPKRKQHPNTQHVKAKT